MLNTLNINLKTDIKTDRPTTLPITLMSQDKNNNQFILRFTNGGESVTLDDTYTVEILTKFSKSGTSRLTSATVRQDYATWEFDTEYITQDEAVYNFVYVRKAGSLVVSADANCFVFSVDLSEIDKGAGKVAETYDENYQKYLDEFKDNVDFEEIAQAEQARKEAEILREDNYEQKVDTAIVEADVVEKVDNKVTELAPQINNLTTQLAQKVGGGKKAEIEDLSDNVILAIEGGEGTSINLLSIPQDKSVDYKKLDDEIIKSAFLLKNKVENGDFSEGTTGWVSQISINRIENGNLVNKATGVNSDQVVATVRKQITLESGKSYGRIFVRARNSTCAKIDFFIINGTGGEGTLGREYGSVINPVQNQWYEISGVVQANQNAEVYIRHLYNSQIEAYGSEMEVSSVFVSDLTETFGFGNEPNQELLEKLIGTSTYRKYYNLFNAKQFTMMNNNDGSQIPEETESVEKELVDKKRVDESIINTIYGINTRWKGKTGISEGDSITWYDGKPFATTHISEGEIAKGYQSYMREVMGMTVLNNGASGMDMRSIYENQIKNKDYANFDFATLTSGANDERLGTPVGTVVPKGSSFDLGTYSGAMQAGIEKMRSDNPNIYIILITPIPGFFKTTNTTLYPSGFRPIKKDYIDKMREIGNLYNIPVCDWYNQVGINESNIKLYLGDKDTNTYYLHPNNIMFKRMASVLLPFLIKNQPSS